MSLIQEALQRHNQETGAPLTLARPSAAMPPPLPPPPTVPPRRPWPWLLLGLVILMVGGGVYWAFFLPTSGQPKLKDQTPVARQPAQQPPSKPPVAATPTNVPATNNILAKVKTTLETTVTPERNELVMSKPPAPVAAPPATTTAPPAAATVASAPPTPPTTSAPPPPTPPKAGHWPNLSVTGVMAQSGGNGLVFLNGQMLKRGENWEGAAIIEVTESGARFVFQGETNFIRVGHGTE